MTVVQVELPQDSYQRLREIAARSGRRVEEVAQELLIEQLPPPAPSDERKHATDVLRAAGLLAELAPAEKERAAHASATLPEVQAALAKGSGKTLSEIVIEQRGPKV